MPAQPSFSSPQLCFLLPPRDQIGAAAVGSCPHRCKLRSAIARLFLRFRRLWRSRFGRRARGDAQHHAAHDIAQLEVSARTVAVLVVARDACGELM